MISNRSTGKTDQSHFDPLIAVMSVVQNTEHCPKTIFHKIDTIYSSHRKQGLFSFHTRIQMLSPHFTGRNNFVQHCFVSCMHFYHTSQIQRILKTYRLYHPVLQCMSAVLCTWPAQGSGAVIGY